MVLSEKKEDRDGIERGTRRLSNQKEDKGGSEIAMRFLALRQGLV